jgi:hypothetical protein
VKYVSPSEALHALSNDRLARAEFIESLIKTARGRFLPEADGRLLTTVVFDKAAEELGGKELQVDVAVKTFAVDALDRLQQTVDTGNLEFRGEFEAIEIPADDWGDATIERRLAGLTGWNGRAVQIYIRPDRKFDRLLIDVH